MARFFPLGLILFIFSSCLNEPDCVVTATNIVRVSFERLIPDSLNTDTVVFIDSVQVSGTFALYHEGDTTSQLQLPVDPQQLTTTFRVFYYDSIMDSIRISYTRKAQVVSPACGAFTHFQDLVVLSTSFGNLIVEDPTLSSSATSNIIIKL